MRKILILFLIMLKIGVFTFGGGYAMLALLENEFVAKRQWIESEEFMDLTVIAESTPGPIAVNAATFIGYKQGKLLGAIVGTLGICLPSFTIIFLISLFFDSFLSVAWVAAAFKGVQICAIFLVLSAGWKMMKKLSKTAFNVIVFCLTFACMTVFSLFSVRFSSIFYILISASVGLFLFAVKKIKSQKRKENQK